MKKPYKYVRARCSATQPVIPALRIGGGIQSIITSVRFIWSMILRRKILINSFILTL